MPETGVPEFTGNKQQSDRMADQERERGGRGGGREGRTAEPSMEKKENQA